MSARAEDRTGARIRARRTERGGRQADLARACGISPSYLNLIEHDRRRIGGALLLRIARALEVDPAALAEGAGAGLLAELREAAARPRARGGATPEAERADDFATRFPGWAGLVAAQSGRLRELEGTVAALGDRLAHDARLAGALHEVLSAATAIRSAAAILTDPAGIDPPWQRRFLRNIAEDSARLAHGAEALAGSLGEAGTPGAGPAGTPREEFEDWLATRADSTGAAAEPPAEAALPAGPAARALALAWTGRLAEDRAALPDAALRAALAEHPCDLARAAHALRRPLGLVLRRIAHLPGEAGRTGLVLCDASGAPILRRPVAGFAMPRFAAPCPLWPLYDALTAPGRPVRVVVEGPGPAAERHEAWAVAERSHPEGLAGPARVEAVMLIRAPRGEGGEVRGVGPGCRVCPREGCGARREPAILHEAPAAHGL